MTHEATFLLAGRSARNLLLLVLDIVSLLGFVVVLLEVYRAAANAVLCSLAKRLVHLSIVLVATHKTWFQLQLAIRFVHWEPLANAHPLIVIGVPKKVPTSVSSGEAGNGQEGGQQEKAGELCKLHL